MMGLVWFANHSPIKIPSNFWEIFGRSFASQIFSFFNPFLKMFWVWLNYLYIFNFCNVFYPGLLQEGGDGEEVGVPTPARCPKNEEEMTPTPFPGA